MRTLVIGVGNLLRCDDGAGIHVINRLRETAPDINVEEVALGSIEILEAMKGYEQVIIVDAIRTGADPGTIFKVNLIKEEKPPNISTSHGVDIVTTLELGMRLFPQEMPRNQILIGIEAEDLVTFSEECTPKVSNAVNKVVKEIISIIK